MLAVDANAQRGGAVRGGVRGAVAGEVVGGDSGAKAGAVIGATRGAVDRGAMVAENQVRAQYATTPAYQSAQLSNFNQAQPQVLVTPQTSPPTAAPTAASGEVVIHKDGRPVAAITFPDDWKQQKGERFVAATSADGHAWVAFATVEGVKDNQAGMEKIKEGLQKSLKDVKYDDPVKSERGALVVTGTGKAMKSGAPEVFALGVIDAASGQPVGIAFIVDEAVDEHYKEAARYICKTIRLAKDLAK
jgi:hypothetical protein